MKVFIIAALTADGFIGRTDNHLPNWTSPEDKKRYMQITKDAGVMVMGSKTFDVIGKPLPGRKTIVYTSRPEDYEGFDIVATSESPQELTQRLKKEGLKELAVCGGATVYAQFINAGVVDEAYITIEPKFFGQGISLFSKEVDAQLSLLNLEKLNKNSLFLHYAVKK